MVAPIPTLEQKTFRKPFVLDEGQLARLMRAGILTLQLTVQESAKRKLLLGGRIDGQQVDPGGG